jgi:hypothetical protein
MAFFDKTDPQDLMRSAKGKLTAAQHAAFFAACACNQHAAKGFKK